MPLNDPSIVPRPHNQTHPPPLTYQHPPDRFKAPWCGHCKSMTPAFDELGAVYNGPASSTLIAYVDCTVETDLCGKYEVQGYPTLKVFTQETGLAKGKPYEGGRDAASLKKYVEENFISKCAVSTSEGCTDKEKAFISKMKSSSKTELTEQLARLDKMKSLAMSSELKQWVLQRITILTELSKVAA